MTAPTTTVLVTAGWKRGAVGILIDARAVWPDGRTGPIVRIGEWKYEIPAEHWRAVGPGEPGAAA